MKLRYHRIVILLLVAMIISVPVLSQSSYAMTEEELPEGEVILSDINLQGAVIKPGSERYGSMEVVEVEGEAFTQALRFTTDVQPAYTYDFQYEIPIYAAIEKDDVMLASFYARTISSSHETAEGSAALVMEKLQTWDKSITEQVSIPAEWKKFYVPIVAALDMGENQSQVAFRVGFKPQVIEIADIKVINFKKAITIDDLPRTPVYYEGMEEDAPWRAEANERIEQYRKGDFEVIVLDENGESVEGADVHAQMTKHDFKFGTAVNSAMLFGTDENAELYREKLKENFNAVVMENEMKWPWWEGDKARTVNLYNWLGENGFSVRGHTLLWDGLTRMPADIGEIYGDPNQIHKRIEDHFHEVAGYFKGRIVDWDVINEPTANSVIRGTYGDEIAADWFKLAKEADPYAKLYVNETQIIGIDGPVIGQFSNILESLIDAGAPIDGIGIQGHFGSTPVAPMAFYNQLTHFGQYADELAITEFDMNSPRADIQGQFTRDILIASFSHPQVQSFTMWGFWDGAHWQSNAPLYTSDWTLKPSGEEWKRLIYEEWWTDEQGKTDAEGKYTIRGFYGEYEVTVDYEGVQQVYQTSLVKDADNKLVVVLGDEQAETPQEPFIPLPVPSQQDEITAPVWRYGSAFLADNVSPTSATLQWPEAHDNIGISSYRVYKDGQLLAEVPATVTSYDVTALEKDHTYIFTIVAVDGAGNTSVESSEINVTTKQASDTTLPGWKAGATIAVTELDTDSATLSWPKAIDNVAVEGYRVYVNNQFVAETKELSYSLQHLNEHTIYMVRVEAQDKSGNLSLGGPAVTFKTLGMPDTITPFWGETAELTATDITHQSVTLQWTAAEDNRAVTAYRILQNNKELITLPANRLSYQVRGLSENSEVQFKVEAVDAAGNWSATGPIVTITTAVEHDEEKPVWPANRLLSYGGLTDHEVTLQWTAAQDNIGVTAYKIYRDGEELAIVAGDELSYVATNLSNGQSYTFAVEAVDGFNNSSTDGPSIIIQTYEGLVRQEVKVAPSDDAFPQSPALGNFGGDGFNNNGNFLRYKNAAGASGSEEMKNTGNNRRIYMKFPLHSIEGNITEATLNVYVFAVQSPNMDIGMDVYATGDNWSESTINWINKPAAGQKLASTTIRNAGYWKSIDVTDYVIEEASGDQLVSFLLQDDLWLDQNVDIHSKEASDPLLRPYINISSEVLESDTTAPVWVEGSLQAADLKPHQVALAWSGAEDEAGIVSYSIIRDGERIAIVGSDVKHYIVTGLSPATSYTFSVEASDTMQESSNGPSITIVTEAQDETPPSWAEDVSLAASGVSRHSVTLQWSEASDQYGVANYVIYADDAVIVEVDGSKTSHTINHLTAGNEYEFTVYAVDAAGNEAKGPSIVITTEAPDIQSPVWADDVELEIVELETNGIFLAWPHATDDTAVTGYALYLDEAKIAQLGANITEYYVYGLQPNTSYQLGLYAVDEAGNVSEPLVQDEIATLEIDNIYPTWPTGARMTVTLDGENVQLQWIHATDNIAVKQYYIYRNGLLLTTVSGDQNSYLIDHSTDVDALYKVEAEDYSGNVTSNGPSTSDMEIPVPEEPTPTKPNPPTSPDGNTGITQGNEVKLVNGQVVIQVKELTTLNGQVTATLDEASLDAAFKQSKAADNGDRKIIIELPNIEGAVSYLLQLPKAYVSEKGKQQLIELSTALGSLILPGNMLANNETAKGEETVGISIAATSLHPSASINGEVDAVLELKVVAANGQALTFDNEEATVLVKVPYKLADNEQSPFVNVWYVDAQGKASLVPTGRMDGQAAEVQFKTDHFSQYAIAYYNKSFLDLTSVPWAKQQIEVLASKGMINGVSAQAYAPTSNVTRADFTKLLVETLALTASSQSSINSFSDVTQQDYYYEAVTVAQSLGIVEGSGNGLFNPKAYITRQDMMVIISRALDVMSIELPQLSGIELSTYADAAGVSSYAKEAVTALLESGLIQGSNNAIKPQSHATRAETAVIMYRLFQLIYQ